MLVYSRSAGVVPDERLTEEHWSYMDRFAGAMTARGPTLTADRATWTGSLHILELPGPEAAREFVAREPYNRAGMFATHLVRRFENRLGRTMWEFPAGPVEPRFLVIAHLRPGPTETPAVELTTGAPERVVLHGDLSALEDGTPAGVVLALQAPAREAVDALLRRSPGIDERFDVEIHDWEFGGRR